MLEASTVPCMGSEMPQGPGEARAGGGGVGGVAVVVVVVVVVGADAAADEINRGSTLDVVVIAVVALSAERSTATQVRRPRCCAMSIKANENARARTKREVFDETKKTESVAAPFAVRCPPIFFLGLLLILPPPRRKKKGGRYTGFVLFLLHSLKENLGMSSREIIGRFDFSCEIEVKRIDREKRQEEEERGRLLLSCLLTVFYFKKKKNFLSGRRVAPARLPLAPPLHLDQAREASRRRRGARRRR